MWVNIELFEEGSSYVAHLEGLDVFHATFACPDPTACPDFDELG